MIIWEGMMFQLLKQVYHLFGHDIFALNFDDMIWVI